MKTDAHRFCRCSCSLQRNAWAPIFGLCNRDSISISQARFHEEQASASASPIEKCRHHLHVGALLSAILSAVYFAMVVADEMWLSLVVLGVLQIPVFISLPVLSTRMWIYT